MANALAEQVVADLVPLGPVRPRPWFGGTALTLDGVQFGFTFEDRLFVRANADLHARAAAAGTPPFQYPGNNGKPVVMRSYCGVPPAVIAAPGALLEWAGIALEVAVAAARAKGVRALRGVAAPSGH